MNLSRFFGRLIFWLRFALIYIRNDPRSVSIKECMKFNPSESQKFDKKQVAEIHAFRQIYCQGPILDAVQKAHLFNDSKYFVDMAIKYCPIETLNHFYDLGDKINDKKVLQKFVDDHFDPPGTELEKCSPSDWHPYPRNVRKIRDIKFQSWALSLNDMWQDLCREVRSEVYYYPQRFSLLYVPHPFIIPGGRFREFYYWDSYWIIKGLIFSGMFDMAKGIIRNYGYMINQYGFVPNGGRVYYLQRSQPPLLTAMVYDLYQATLDKDFIIEMLPHLDEEYNFWKHYRRTLSRHGTGDFQYNVRTSVPRPESYREDLYLVRNLKSLSDKEKIWSDIASAAETGWDLSSRWFAFKGSHSMPVSSIRTTSIIPVDLQAFMCMNAKMLSQLYDIAGNHTSALRCEARYIKAKARLKEIHWHEQDGIWYDYDAELKEHRRQYYLSNALPLFAHCYNDGEKIPRTVFNYLKRVGAFKLTEGIPTSFIQSSQQWDSVNAWPPLVHMIIEGFHTSNDKMLKNFARDLAEQWLRTNYEAFGSSEIMYEKYNVDPKAAFGGTGGEYEVQTGFGWTNGVVLDLLDKFGDVVMSRAAHSLMFNWKTIVLIYVINFLSFNQIFITLLATNKAL